jgi:hypothetical protein
MSASKSVRRGRQRAARPAKKNGHGGARKGAGRPKKIRRIHDYQQLGDCPEDELEAMRWMFRANGVRARQVMLDQGMSDERRGSELRAISKTMNSLLPRSRLRRAERSVRGEAEEIKRQKASPEVTPAPEFAPAKEGA